jgi:hypothetical protein
MKEKSGVPANINPFCIYSDNDIADGMFETIAPRYFSFNSAGDTTCPSNLNSPELTQTEAENLVRSLFNSDPCAFLAIREEFVHIIPADIKGRVLVGNPEDREFGRCLHEECYYIDDGITKKEVLG